MKNKIVEYILVVVAFIVLINLFASNLIEIQEAAAYVEVDRIIFLQLLSSLYIILIGLLVERHLIVKLIKTQRFKITPTFFVGLFMVVIGLLHATFYMKIGVFSLHQPFPNGGFGLNILFAPLFQGASVQHLITLLGTIILIRGLVNKKEAEAD
jgi:hypothetical protein